MSGQLGSGTRNVTVNISKELYIDFHALAARSGVRSGEFLRALIDLAVEEKIVVREKPEDRMAFYDAVQNEIKPLPKIRLEAIFTKPLAAEKFLPTDSVGKKRLAS